MAKKDAIYNYGSAFNTSSYIAGIQTDWDNNVSSARDTRLDISWRGTPSTSFSDPSTINSVSQISGWESGTWKRLDMYEIAFNKIEGGFASTTHKLLYDIKRAFNLPNQENFDTWIRQYTRDAGEDHCLWYSKGGHTPAPMTISDSTNKTLLNWHGDNNPLKCALLIPISGFDYFGGADNSCKWQVWPTSTDANAMQTHYKTLEDASTASASWTNPTRVGSEFTQASTCCLVNFENYWGRVADPAQDSDDCLLFTIGWTTHTYAQIKTLIDTAIA